MRPLARLLLPRLSVISRPPDFYVGGLRDPYLRRWWLIPRNRFFNIYLHNMLRSDDDVLHDHPWWSLSLVLDDGMSENYVASPGNAGHAGANRYRVLRQGRWIWRSSHFAHQLVVHRSTWTLFFTGPIVREWGFYCKKGWKPWKEYVSLRDQVSTVGQGCGEQDD